MANLLAQHRAKGDERKVKVRERGESVRPKSQRIIVGLTSGRSDAKLVIS